ncbi:MAG: histidinol dehydrogenase [Enterobacter hormaechei]
MALCEDEAQLIAFADHMATEHLQVHTRDPHATAAKIRNYGSLFSGQNASVVFSDKCCGTNHTLPSMAAARYTGGLWDTSIDPSVIDTGYPAIAEPAFARRTERCRAPTGGGNCLRPRY